MPDENVTREDVARLEGKLDAYAAGQSARLDGIDKRLDRHDEAIDDIRAAARPTRTSGWQVASVAISGVVGLGSLVGVLIVLMQVVAKAG
jgi:hypothetical protein